MRLTAPNGATVRVSEERAKQLLKDGYAPADDGSTRKAGRKTTAKKAASGSQSED